MTSDMHAMLGNSMLYGANMAYIENLYETYLAAPESVSDQWRVYFDTCRAGRLRSHGIVCMAR